MLPSATPSLHTMSSVLRSTVKRVLAGFSKETDPDGWRGIARLGHREYIGGLWEEMGSLQFDFMRERGLKPEHVLLDIACGSLRGGRHFIAYLDPGHYLGIEKERSLVEAGLKEELTPDLRRMEPEIVISERFEFECLSKTPDYSLAQSLFTHLTDEDVELCLANLRRFVEPGHLFYATFFTGEDSLNPSHSHARHVFRFSPEQLAEIGGRHGWRCDYIGDWNHPRDQVMMEFCAV